MEIISIFGNHLFAIKYPNEEKDEFARLLELWNDPEYLENFFEENKEDLTYYGGISVESAIFDTYDHANNFEKNMLRLAKDSQDDQKKGLDTLFRPLSNVQSKILPLNESKSRHKWLRFYGLKLDDNVYIITGGAIKLTLYMEDRNHTNNELSKLSVCKAFLRDKGIVDIDGLIEEMEL